MDNYVGEIRQFGGNFAPQGWAFCNGQLMSISENDVLFTLVGTTYGGDGQNTFGLPNLQGRVPIHQGTNQTTYVMGQLAGQEQVTLATNQLPTHNHLATASSVGGSDNPSGNVWGASTTGLPYEVPPGSVTMNPGSIGMAGSTLPHDNMHPFLAVSFIISLYGIYPTQS